MDLRLPITSVKTPPGNTATMLAKEPRAVAMPISTFDAPSRCMYSER